MALRCFNCTKGIMYGHNVSHSKRRTRRIFKPNLHHAKITVNGTTKKVKLCTKCLRMVRQDRKPVKTENVEAGSTPIVETP
ncbi:MAG: 50S ribosomal protein L28 [Candidatus Levybacteria bacterium RBG_16_35_6]|nr:MAG: 50S ribosomal protein L28 [Candidatus Levybacteria bacterium RBG_16_35_6]